MMYFISQYGPSNGRTNSLIRKTYNYFGVSLYIGTKHPIPFWEIRDLLLFEVIRKSCRFLSSSTRTLYMPRGINSAYSKKEPWCLNVAYFTDDLAWFRVPDSHPQCSRFHGSTIRSYSLLSKIKFDGCPSAHFNNPGTGCSPFDTLLSVTALYTKWYVDCRQKLQ